MRFDSHPDANQIAACIEGRLAPRQARALRRHLGRCAACRQWAACTSTLCVRSGVAAPPVGTPRTALGYWIATPLALAASVVVVAGVLWRAPVAVQAPPAKMATPARAAARVVIAQPKPAARRAPRRVAAAQPGMGAVQPAGRPDSPNSDAGQALRSQDLPQPAEELAVAPAFDFTPLASGFADQPAQRGAQAELAAWGGATPFQPIRSEPVATALLPPVMARGGMAPASGPASGMALGWAISRGGQVLRSIGSGLWATVPLVPGVHFRALASAGRAIWAGGRSDQVYVSPDQGAHWTQVVLPEVGTAPQDLASISASDEAHVTIADGNGREWSTRDGGASWVVTKR